MSLQIIVVALALPVWTVVVELLPWVVVVLPPVFELVSTVLLTFASFSITTLLKIKSLACAVLKAIMKATRRITKDNPRDFFRIIVFILIFVFSGRAGNRAVPAYFNRILIVSQAVVCTIVYNNRYATNYLYCFVSTTFPCFC